MILICQSLQNLVPYGDSYKTEIVGVKVERRFEYQCKSNENKIFIKILENLKKYF